MSIAEFTTVLMMLCGKGDTDRHWDCYDYYNNCVITTASPEPSVKALEKCKANYSDGVKRIIKLKEQK